MKGLATELCMSYMNGECELDVHGEFYGRATRFFTCGCSPNVHDESLLYYPGDKRVPELVFFAAENIPPLQEFDNLVPQHQHDPIRFVILMETLRMKVAILVLHCVTCKMRENQWKKLGISVLKILKFITKVQLSLEIFKKCNQILNFVKLIQLSHSMNFVQLNKQKILMSFMT